MGEASMGTPDGHPRNGSLIPTSASLDTWSGRDWSDGIMVNRLLALDRLTVRTLNSTYEIIVVQPGTAEVYVRGGAFFPEFTRARVAGSSLGGSFLKLHAIHVGFRMELADDRQTIVTSLVVSVAPSADSPVSRPM
jgi:hypothetical protein